MKRIAPGHLLALCLGMIALLAAPVMAGPAPVPVTLGDFSGDGRMDVLVQGDAGLLYVYVTDATGKAVDATESAAIVDLPSGWSVVGLADFNGDDHTDTLVQEAATGILYTFITDSTTAAGAPIEIATGSSGHPVTVPAGFSVVGVGDADGNGLADIYVQDDASGLLYTYITAAGGITVDHPSSGSPVVVPVGWEIQSIGDYNGDDRSDVVVQNTGVAGTLYTWVTDADGISFDNDKSGSPFGVPATWAFSGGGDYTSGTDSSDIVLSSSTGLVYVVAINADGVTANFGASALNLSLPAGFSVQGIGDFNKDGNADTLVNHASGFLYVFLNTSPSRVSDQGLITTVPGTFDLPVNPGF